MTEMPVNFTITPDVGHSLGQWVRVNATLERHSRRMPVDGQAHWCKIWDRTPRYAGSAVGVIVGIRTLTDGWTENNYGYDDPPVWMPFAHRQAFMVAVDLYRKPIFALREDLDIINEEHP